VPVKPAVLIAACDHRTPRSPAGPCVLQVGGDTGYGRAHPDQQLSAAAGAQGSGEETARGRSIWRKCILYQACGLVFAVCVCFLRQLQYRSTTRAHMYPML
jgi:hypothetical protein